MKLGDRVKFQKELLKKVNGKTTETIQFGFENSLISQQAFNSHLEGKYINPLHWGVFDNKKILEGTYCGKRLIDMTGSYGWDEGWYMGKKMVVHLVATNVMGFHRVPECFIITENVNEEADEETRC